MASSCCAKRKIKSDSLFTRSFVSILLGGLLLFPPMEHILSVGLMGQIFFIGVSFFMMYSLNQDFSEKREYCLGMLLAVGLALATPFLNNILTIQIFLTASIALSVLFLFISDDVWDQLHASISSFFTKNIPSTSKVKNIFEFPSVEKIILFFVVLNWGISCAAVAIPHQMIYSFVLHDPLLILGIFNLSSWVKQSMQTRVLTHNHEGEEVTIVSNKGENQRISISNLKKGMKIKIEKEVMIPVKCTVVQQCQVADDVSEKRIDVQNGQLSCNRTFYSGVVQCDEDYHSVDHATQSKHSEDTDYRLGWLLILSLSVAFMSGFWKGFLMGSVASGLQMFCLNLIVSCPCVFLIAKPIIHSKFLDWLKSFNTFEFNKMPTCGKPNILVFDRTHTLYEEKRNAKPNDPYELNAGIKNLMRKLKSQKIELYILSGHGSGNYQENLKKCKKDFKNIIEEDHIIFERKFHCPKDGEKREVIKNLQWYGRVDKPQNVFIRFICFIKRIFQKNIVGMIGDGGNDVAAMQQADLSICVSKKPSVRNNDVAKNAHFFSCQKQLKQLTPLIQALGTSNSFYEFFIFLALSYNVFMLLMVNGLSTYLFGMAFSPTIGCLIVSSFCIGLTFSASLISVKPSVSKEDLEKKQKNHCGCGNHSCHHPVRSGDTRKHEKKSTDLLNSKCHDFLSLIIKKGISKEDQANNEAYTL